MFKGLIGKKIGMTQIFDEEGVAIPVTLIEAGPATSPRYVRLKERVILVCSWVLRSQTQAPDGW